jgi:hypothetical protein
MTDREYLQQLLVALRVRADAGPMSVAEIIMRADAIELQLYRAVPPKAEPTKCPHGVSISPATVCLQCADPAFHAASRNNPTPYQTFTLTGETQQASALNQSLCAICGEPNFSIPRLGIGHVCKLKPNATYWRCIHHPSLIENMKDHRYVCEHGCHKSELRWYDNGTCKPQTS